MDKKRACARNKMSNDDVIDLCNDNDDENTTEFEVRKGETLNFVSTITH